jgi:hypothetical protein
MPLSWNEIKSRAVAFTKEWKHEVSEDAEAKGFWDDSFMFSVYAAEGLLLLNIM